MKITLHKNLNFNYFLIDEKENKELKKINVNI